MLPPFEVLDLTSSELRQELEASLPTNLTLFLDASKSDAIVEIRDVSGNAVWSNTFWDLRYLLLEAYGWVWLRRSPETTSKPWIPRKKDLTTRDVQRHALQVEDPPDVDPTELETFFNSV